MIEFKTPSEENVFVMKEFANVIDSALSLLGKPELQNISGVVAQKLQEALMWFSHGVLNSAVVEDPAKASEDAGKTATDPNETVN